MNKDTVDKAVKMAKELFGKDVEVKVLEVTKKGEENTSDENTSEGTETPIPNSLISDEEKAQVKVVLDEVHKLVELHGGRLDALLKAEKDDYTMLQYMMYSDFIGEVVESIKSLDLVANEMTKKDFDDKAKEHNITVHDMCANGVKHHLLEAILKN